MSLKVKRVVEIEKYIPVDYREADNPPRIHMRRVKPLAAAKVRDSTYELTSKGKVKSINIMSTPTRMVLKSLCGWDNVEYDDGTNIPFDGDNVEDMLDLLGTDLQRELEAVFGQGARDYEAEEKLIKEAAEEDSDSDDEDEDDEGNVEGDGLDLTDVADDNE